MALQHMKKLEASNHGDLKFIEAILERLDIIEKLHRRVRGTSLLIPPDLATDMKRFNTLTARYMAGDYRHSHAETLAARSVAQWTMDVNAELRNKPKEELKWVDLN